MAQNFLRCRIVVKAVADTFAQKLSRLSCFHRAGLSVHTRVIHETKKATQHLQSVFVVMMNYIKSSIKVWLDGSLLLCDATNETFVSDMLCSGNKKVCKHCKENFTVLGTRGDPIRKQSQANLVTVVNLCLILSRAHRGHRTSLATPLGRDLSCFMLSSVG
jgi:hypothetical protein